MNRYGQLRPPLDWSKRYHVTLCDRGAAVSCWANSFKKKEKEEKIESRIMCDDYDREQDHVR